MTIPIHKIIIYLLIPAFVVLAWYFGVSVTQENYRVLALPVVLAVGFVAFFWIPQYLWVFAVGSIFVPGQITGFGFPVTLTELLVLFLTIRYATENIIIRKQWINLGPSPEKLFLLIFIATVIYHAAVDRMGMRIFGSDLWGGRGYLAILLAYLGYVILQSSKLDLNAFRKLPTIVLLMASYEFSIKLITTLFPQSFWFVNRLYFGASGIGFSDNIFEGSRWGFLGNYGYLLILWSVSTCRVSEFLTKQRFFHASVCALGVTLCFLSGFRSAVGNALFYLAIASFRDLGFRSAFAIIPAIMGLAALSFIHTSGIFRLPYGIQRGLTFLPGDWDAQVVADAQGSLEFRFEVWKKWREDMFPQSPVIGRGIALNPDEMLATIPYTTGVDPITGMVAMPTHTRDEAFVISGNLHHTFYSLVDRFGLIGMIGCIGFCILAAYKIGSYLIHNRHGKLCPPLEWLAIYSMNYLLFVWPGALRIENMIPSLLLTVGIFYSLHAVWKPAQEQQTVAQQLPVPTPALARPLNARTLLR